MKPDSLAPDRLTQVGSTRLTGRGRQCTAMLNYAMQDNKEALQTIKLEKKERYCTAHVVPALLVALANHKNCSGDV